MAHLRAHTHEEVGEYVVAGAVGLGIALSLPVLGVVAFMSRGILAGIALAVLATGLTAWVWRAIEPTLAPRTRRFVHDAALAAATLVFIPLAVVLVLWAEGTVLALLAPAAITAAVIGGWRLAAAAGHLLRRRRRRREAV